MPTDSHQLPRTTFRARVLLAMVRFHWFIRLRWLITVSVLAVLLVERHFHPKFIRPWQIFASLAFLAVVNVGWTLIGQRLLQFADEKEDAPQRLVRRVERFAYSQMTVDLLALTLILRYSGGLENPMAVFYLFHMLIAALLLRPRHALMQGGWALLLYGALGFGEALGLVRPHYPFLPSTSLSVAYQDWTFALAGVGVLAAGVFGTLYFTLQISSRLDQQEREQRELNMALQRSREAIQDLQARRSRFMQTAAHQLKSPLTGIEMLAGLIRDGVVPPERVRGTVARIISRCREAILQVGELLTLARIQEGDPAAHRSSTTEISKVVNGVVKRFAETAAAKRLGFVAHAEGCDGAFAAVAERDLEDCVTNLIENAIKYTPEGGRVEVSTACGADTITITVKDTGMGIAEDSVDDIFDPFRRGNLALAAGIPGSGLGLAIVREVVEQAHGHIEVRSAIGQGSEFIVSFPRHDAPAESAPVRGTRSTRMTKRSASHRPADRGSL